MGSLTERAAAAPALRPFDSSVLLAGPDPRLGTPDPAASAIVTGGGLVAVVEPIGGLLGIWREGGAILGGLSLGEAGAAASSGAPGIPRDTHGHGSGVAVGGGAWERRLLLSDGRTLVERGLLPDDPPAVVVQWSLPAGENGAPVTLTVRAHAPDGATVQELPVTVTPGRPAGVALRGEGADATRVETLLRSLAAREKLRSRRLSEEGRLRIRWDGNEDAELHTALVRLSDALAGLPIEWPLPSRGNATAPPRGAAPYSPWFVGAPAKGGTSPRSLTGGEMAELGRAALRGGVRPLALQAMRTLASRGGTPSAAGSLGYLRLVADWIAWTGDLEPVFRDRTAVEEAARGAAIRLPGDLGTLKDVVPPPTGGATVAEAAVVLARIDAFLGAEPDARYGRLRLGPRLTGDWTSFELDGLASGDARIELRVHREPSRVELRVGQVGGRVPINLVFEPLIEGEVREVRIGGATAKVERNPEPGLAGPPRTRLRCQFPLDPERVVTILTDPP